MDDPGLRTAVTELADSGRRDAAVTVAQTISDTAVRDQVLSHIATGRKAEAK